MQFQRTFNQMQNVGKTKYVVNYHNGEKTHKDGSPFFDMATFSNRKDKNAFVRSLRSSGYVEQ